MSEDQDKKARVLVVEDDEAARTAVVEILGALGYEDVGAVSNGDHAIKILNRNPRDYPIAIIDIFLPDMTAKHLARNFPRDHGIQKLLILSGGTADDFAAVRSVFERHGVADVQTIKKPATLEMLQRFLEGA